MNAQSARREAVRLARLAQSTDPEIRKYATGEQMANRAAMLEQYSSTNYEAGLRKLLSSDNLELRNDARNLLLKAGLSIAEPQPKPDYLELKKSVRKILAKSLRTGPTGPEAGKALVAEWRKWRRRQGLA